MYLDKIYNKLFSQKNEDGINQLLHEVKLFAAADLNARIQELLNTINLKKSRGEDASKEMQELQSLQSQLQANDGSGGGGLLKNLDPNVMMGKANRTIGNLTQTVRNVNFLGDAIKNIGGALFH